MGNPEGEPRNLCMGCMAEKDGEGPCRQCGYTGSELVDADALAPGTLLAQRYLLGKLLHFNGESAYYIGYDQQEDARVYIREFMPRRIVSRNHSNGCIKPIKNHEAVYKSLLAEFEDLCGRLKGMNTVRGVTQVLDVIQAQDTAYAVYRYMNVLLLGDMVNQCGGEIKWAKCKKIFLSLLNTLTQIHKRGLIHAGISPSTILVDDKGIPYLSCFSVNAARALGSEIDSELFDGYSAPEQYETNEGYGEWTDLYAISAVLYRVITGTMPPRAPDRKISDNLVDARQLDKNIPENVSDAIRNGMILSTLNRIQNADELSAQLLDNVETNTAVYAMDVSTDLIADSPEAAVTASGEGETPHKLDREGKKAARKARREMRRMEKKPHRKIFTVLSLLIPMALTTAVLGILVYLFLQYKLTDLVSFSPTPSESEQASQTSQSVPVPETPTVPEFVGQYIDNITTNSEYGANFQFETRYEFNDQYANGVVFDQSPKSQTLMPNRGTVILFVSKGKDSVKLPNLAGNTLDLAKQMLDDLELSYQVIYQANDAFTEGLVAYTEPAADTVVRRTDEELVVLIITRAPIPESSSSEMSDTSESTSSNKYKLTKPPEPSKPKAKKITPEDRSSSSSERD